MVRTLWRWSLIIDFMDAVKTCLRKYFTFSGRARRSEYWWFYLSTIIVAIVAAIIDGSIVGWQNTDEGPVGTVTSLALLFPYLSAGWRRLHDTGRSGWWIGGGILAFVFFIVVIIASAAMAGFDDGGTFFGDGLIGVLAIGFLIGLLIYGITLLVFMCQDSHPSDNKYGPSAKYDSGASVFD